MNTNRILDPQNFNHRYTISKNLIGEGGYGKVYVGQDILTGEDVAIKITDIHPKTGLVSILELSIMSSYSYSYINSARCIYSDGLNTYIVQNLAKRDLRREVRKTTPTFEKAKKWCYQISKGLCSLHEQGIIHCDIKPANVLVYKDGNIKLNDFTLAVIKYSSDDTFRRDTCTVNYRPPESLMSTEWDESLDIWSLGCTFYEICTGKKLIPSQESILTGVHPSTSDSQLRQLYHAATYRSIIDWRSQIGDYQSGARHSGSSDFVAVQYCPEWAALPSSFQDLIISMTSFNRKLRPKIVDIIRHPIFGDLSGPCNVNIREIHPGVIPRSVETYIEQYVHSVSNERLVLKVTKDLYCRIVVCFPDQSPTSVFLRIETCIWLAEKLVHGRPVSKLKSNLAEILVMERTICEKLRYNLHFHPPPKLYVLGSELRQ